MNIVYLNGDYMPMEEARISPMDRGFLFGDGIYEVVPSYDGKMVGFGPHLERMQDGLDAIEIKLTVNHAHWRAIADQLVARNGGGNLGLYFHVSRGADSKRRLSGKYRAYPVRLRFRDTAGAETGENIGYNLHRRHCRGFALETLQHQVHGAAG